MSSRLAANTVDAAALADELAKFRIIDPSLLVDLLSDFSGGGPAALVEHLVRHGVLTDFQADRALAGESRAIALGPYRLTGLANPGIFGSVFTATHRDKRGEFRLWICPVRSLWKAREAKQIVRALAGVQHAAIVPLIDVDSANGFHYLAWPHVEGERLTENMKRSGPLPEGEVIGLLAHLADALHVCHIRRIVHGALTPGSIVLDRNAFPRLLELGAGAILSTNLLKEETFLDTLSTSLAATEILKFAAPEYINNPIGTPASDQYALGAIGYFALTGEAPFASSSLANSLSAKVEGQPRSLDAPAIPQDLAGIISRMLRVNPEDRFSGLDEVQDRLAGIGGTSQLVGQTVPSNSAPHSEGLRSFAQREPVGSGSNVGWPAPGSAIADFPTRDDSDASITFELPPPVADVFPEPVIPRAEFIERKTVASDGITDPPSPSVETLGSTGRENEHSPESHQDEPEDLFAASEREPHPLLPKLFHGLSQPIVPPNISPARTSPAQPEDLHMANPLFPDPFEGSKSRELQSKTATPPDPRKGVSTPVHYHTEIAESSPGPTRASSTATDDRSGTDSALWKKVKRSLLFWQAPMDNIRISIFGPATIVPGQQAKLSVFLHTAEAAESVRTLSRAFHHDSELIGTGFLAQEVARDTELGVHLSVANAGVSRTLLPCVWRGQPQRLVFDLHVPWESPGGPAPGLVSIGRDNVRIGKVEFRLTLLPRKS